MGKVAHPVTNARTGTGNKQTLERQTQKISSSNIMDCRFTNPTQKVPPNFFPHRLLHRPPSLFVRYLPQCIPALEEGEPAPSGDASALLSTSSPLPLNFVQFLQVQSVAMAHGVCQCKCANVSTASSSGPSRKSDHPNTGASRRRGGYIAPPPHPQYKVGTLTVCV